MAHQSNLSQVQRQMQQAKQVALTAIGEFVRSEAQARSPVKTGALRDSNDYAVQEDHVQVGNGMDYAVHVHEGTERQRPQPFLENAVMENVSSIKRLTEQAYRRVGGR